MAASIWVSVARLVVGYSLLSACAQSAPVWNPQTAATRCQGHYDVQPGDTLHGIARRYGCDLKTLAEANRLPPPYWLVSGQRLVLKTTPPLRFAGSKSRQDASGSDQVEVHAVELESRFDTVSEEPPMMVDNPSLALERAQPLEDVEPIKAQPMASLKPVPTEQNSTPPAGEKTTSSSSAWQRPAAGKVIKQYSKEATIKNGIEIQGQVGEPIQAMAAGKVVYQGEGIPGYGKLVMIKHENGYLSVYGHQDQILVQEGQQVHKGQTIGHMGLLRGQQPGVHVELRHHGVAVDPLSLLNQAE